MADAESCSLERAHAAVAGSIAELRDWAPFPKVLSVQSHVVHGCVGNKAAVFPMQLHGVEVDPLNVVQFSNHTGYRVFRGKRLTVDEFQDILEGLRVNGILSLYDVVLSGYVGNADILTRLSETVIEVQQTVTAAQGDSPAKRFYACDPVCGDNGKLYVSDAVLPVYRERLFPLSFLVTPNGFEASVLSGVTVNSVASAREAANALHRMGPPIVVIKSFHDAAWSSRRVGEEPMDGDELSRELLLLLSERWSSGCIRQRVIPIPELRLGYVSGTGDVFAALLLGHLTSVRKRMDGGSPNVDQWCSELLGTATRLAVASTHRLLGAYATAGTSSFSSSPCGVRELNLVRHAAALSDPHLEANEFPLLDC